MEQVSAVKVMLRDGSILDCELGYNRVPPYSLRLRGINFGEKDCIADDLFEAMVVLRRGLEVEGAMLLCAGARADVYPSQMSRSGAGGIRAYITKLGSQTTRDEMVNIFDYSEPNSIGTVDQQIAFHENWIRSLQNETVENVPMAGEIEEAKRFPNGYVYRISGLADPAKAIPPEAIVGAWQVSSEGTIVGGFIENTKYDAVRWPFDNVSHETIKTQVSNGS